MVIQLILMFLILNVICAARLRQNDFDRGMDVNNEFPFIVLFQEDREPYSRFCSGSLIAETWVLTASHCLEISHSIIRYGDFGLPANATKLYVKIIKAFKHPTYLVHGISIPTAIIKYSYPDFHAPRDDIGLVMIENLPKRTKIQPAKLLAFDYRTLYGLPAKFAGFGKTYYSIERQSHVTEEGKTGVTSIQVGKGLLVPCENVKNLGPIICVVSTCSQRMMPYRTGDSGGPMLYDGRIVGVYKGESKTQATLSGAYTPVSIYLQWINQIMCAHKKPASTTTPAGVFIGAES